MGIAVHQFICLKDNFGLLLRDRATNAVASVDAPEADAILTELARLGWGLTDILLTHHHADHVQGTPQLKLAFPAARVVGAKKDAYRLPHLDYEVCDGDAVVVGSAHARVIEAPGHTKGHVLYHFEEDKTVFVGDTLFSLGCGRVFEGTVATLYKTLTKIAELPAETRVFCGHEYTQTNAKFALAVDPNNPALRKRASEIDVLRRNGQATLPTTIEFELAANPFLRADRFEVRRAMRMDDADPVAVFAELRERKNNFAG